MNEEIRFRLIEANAQLLLGRAHWAVSYSHFRAFKAAENLREHPAKVTSFKLFFFL